MKIKGKEITLIQRELTEEEKSDLKFSFKDIDFMTERYRYPKNTPTNLSFVIESGDQVIGEVNFRNIRWYNRKAELSIIIGKTFQKKGYGTDSIKTIIEYAFNNMNLHRLEAEVIENNKASIKLIEKLGFQKEGILREAKFSNGRYYDIYRYGLLRKEHKK